ncbi:hypothetical protein GQ43DRAFT_410017 [Delitschia confertaspora ATCC 74209]|uniref:mRNA export factor MEX67 n=1 Tax=Delitschia confertaspora ATCC 74209 TaxID=1513339 RepID=A0A9P4JRT3_9PLEO|nr:hypothetical protein GQ43DRAFT_410017 [Delitschia confertaspora ATCC 74209]
MPRADAPRRTGARKARHSRTDRDGDLIMGAAAESRRLPTGPSSSKRPGDPLSRSGVSKPQSRPSKTPLKELKVTGWTKADERTVGSLLGFLERHGRKRTKTSGPIIKSNRVQGETLYVRVREEDTLAITKINGFDFQGQKLNITAQSTRGRSNQDASQGDDHGDDPSLDIKALFQGFLTRRYDAEKKLLDLSTLTADPQLQKIGMFDSTSTQSKFFPALMKVCDDQFKTAQQKRDTVHTVSLANNNLHNVSVVNTLAPTFPHLVNLDLSGNLFQTTKDLASWKTKFRHLEHLLLQGNPVLLTQVGWETEVIGWFPRLRTLNGIQVRTDEQVAALDRPKQTPHPSPNPVWQDSDTKICEQFIVDFFTGYDNAREVTIAKYYDAASTFSMAVNAKRGPQYERTSFATYLPQSRNLRWVKNANLRSQRKHRGPEKIGQAWAQLPPTSHPSFQTDLSKYSIDCQPQFGLPDATGQGPSQMGYIINVHGEFQEQHTPSRGQTTVVGRRFHRTFLIGPGASNPIRVHSDSLVLEPYGGVPAWQPIENGIPPTPAVPTVVPPAASTAALPPTAATPAAISTTAANSTTLTAEQLQIIRDVSLQTGMNLQYAQQCLEAGGWDLVAAAALYEANRANLPPEAFIQG